jgi:hypothetical protein
MYLFYEYYRVVTGKKILHKGNSAKGLPKGCEYQSFDPYSRSPTNPTMACTHGFNGTRSNREESVYLTHRSIGRRIRSLGDLSRGIEALKGGSKFCFDK